MRTAPVPNIPAIPGMNPGVFVLGGGGGGGGGRGKGGKGAKNSQKAKGKNGGKGAGGGGKGACGNGTGDPNGGSCPKHHKGKKSGKASKGDPVDVVTGTVFTIPVVDVDLPGPLPLEIARVYYSTSTERDVGLGFGWCHSLAWDIEIGRRSITVWSAQGLGLEFDLLEEGEGATGPEGMVLVRGTKGFVLDTGEGRWLVFEARHGERWLLSAIRDSFDNTISLVYAGGLLSEVRDSAGRVVRVRRGRDGRIAAWELKNAPEQGRWVALGRFTYDERARRDDSMEARLPRPRAPGDRPARSHNGLRARRGRAHPPQDRRRGRGDQRRSVRRRHRLDRSARRVVREPLRQPRSHRGDRRPQRRPHAVPA